MSCYRYKTNSARHFLLRRQTFSKLLFKTIFSLQQVQQKFMVANKQIDPKILLIYSVKNFLYVCVCVFVLLPLLFPSRGGRKQALSFECKIDQGDYTTWIFLAGIYLLKVNNRKTRTRCEICSKLTIKKPERRLTSF